MQVIELRNYPDLKAVIQAAFPDYRKKKAFVSVFGEHGETINSYWDGGSRTLYSIVHIPTRRMKDLPSATHPFFDIAGRGAASQETEDVVSDSRGNLTLKRLPADFALVAAGTFCGKPATAHLFIPAENMPKLLEAGR
jgi:hypothetical protein